MRGEGDTSRKGCVSHDVVSTDKVHSGGAFTDFKDIYIYIYMYIIKEIRQETRVKLKCKNRYFYSCLPISLNNIC